MGDVNPRWELYGLAVLSGASKKKAAEAAGVNERTARDWQSDEGFQAELARLRRSAMGHAATRLAGLTARAARTLGKALGGGVSATQVKAAALILDHAQRHLDLEDFGERLAALERDREFNRGQR